MTPCTIACELHDYIEVACLYGYQVRLILKNGEQIEGKAKDIITANRREYWLIDNGEQQSVELIQLAKVEVLTPHATFKELIL